MTKRDLASLALKLLGVYCFIEAIFFSQVLWYLPTMLVAKDVPYSKGVMIVCSLMPALLAVGMGILLISKADAWAERLSGETTSQQGGSPASVREIQEVAFSIVGLVLVLLALAKAVGLGIEIAYRKSGKIGMAEGISWYDWGRITTVAVQLVLGLWLFLRARGLSNLWHRIQGPPIPGQTE